MSKSAMLKSLNLIAFAIGFVFAISGYSRNAQELFWMGLLLVASSIATLFFVFKRRISKSVFSINVAVAIIFLIAGLALYELYARLSTFKKTAKFDIGSVYSKKAYLYTPGWRNNSTSRLFEEWWKMYSLQWSLGLKAYATKDPEGFLPYKIKLKSRGSFFESNFYFNNLGLRGQDLEILKNKGLIRVVALGESTTWGATIEEKDSPWPDKLQAILNNRNSVESNAYTFEILNAGRAAYRLDHNLGRIEDLLKLDPDVVISYHGWNGFPVFLPDLFQSHYVRKDPTPRSRPSILLENLENSIRQKLINFLYAEEPETPCDISSKLTPKEIERSYDSQYYNLYEKMIRKIPDTIKIIFVSFNMAIDSNSPTDVARFYMKGFPASCIAVKANKLHSLILQKLATEHSNVFFIDSSHGINGNYSDNLFVDIIHFTDEGREALAENIFKGMSQHGFLNLSD